MRVIPIKSMIELTYLSMPTSFWRMVKQIDNELLQIKTGVMDGEKLDDTKIKFLATLPGKDQLRAMFLGVLQAPGSKLARCLAEYQKKMSGGAEAAPAPQA